MQPEATGGVWCTNEFIPRLNGKASKRKRYQETEKVEFFFKQSAYESSLWVGQVATAITSLISLLFPDFRH